MTHLKVSFFSIFISEYPEALFSTYLHLIVFQNKNLIFPVTGIYIVIQTIFILYTSFWVKESVENKGLYVV